MVRNTGIRVQHGATGYVQRVVANAVFTSAPLRLAPLVQKQDNFSGTYRSALSLLVGLQYELGELDLFPKSTKLKGPSIDMSLFTRFEDWNWDFDGTPRSVTYRDAYEGGRGRAAWSPELTQKPLLPNTPVRQRLIKDR